MIGSGLLTLGIGLLVLDTSPRDVAGAVSLVTSLTREAYDVGDPVVVTVRLTNPSQETLVVRTSSEGTGRHAGFDLRVTNEAGEPIVDPYNQPISGMHSLGGAQPLAPGESYTRSLVVNDFVPVLPPGVYDAIVTWEAWSMSPERSKHESPSVRFRILSTSPAVVANKVAGLAQELRQGNLPRSTARLLGFTGHSAAIPPLIDLLHSPEDGDQVAAYEALLYLDHPMVKVALLESLRTEPPRGRLVHLLAVPLRASMGEVRPLLTRWLADPADLTRSAAVEGLRLANIPTSDPMLFGSLANMLGDASPLVRHAATNAIGAYADAAALEALRKVVRDPDGWVREQAIIAVGWVGQAAPRGSALRDEAIALLRSLRGLSSHPHDQAVYWLKQLGAE